LLPSEVKNRCSKEQRFLFTETDTAPMSAALCSDPPGNLRPLTTKAAQSTDPWCQILLGAVAAENP
jgi:hypothetical protein